MTNRTTALPAFAVHTAWPLGAAERAKYSSTYGSGWWLVESSTWSRNAGTTSATSATRTIASPVTGSTRWNQRGAGAGVSGVSTESFSGGRRAAGDTGRSPGVSTGGHSDNAGRAPEVTCGGRPRPAYFGAPRPTDHEDRCDSPRPTAFCPGPARRALLPAAHRRPRDGGGRGDHAARRARVGGVAAEQCLGCPSGPLGRARRARGPGAGVERARATVRGAVPGLLALAAGRDVPGGTTGRRRTHPRPALPDQLGRRVLVPAAADAVRRAPARGIRAPLLVRRTTGADGGARLVRADRARVALRSSYPSTSSSLRGHGPPSATPCGSRWSATASTPRCSAPRRRARRSRPAPSSASRSTSRSPSSSAASCPRRASPTSPRPRATTTGSSSPAATGPPASTTRGCTSSAVVPPPRCRASTAAPTRWWSPRSASARSPCSRR